MSGSEEKLVEDLKAKIRVAESVYQSNTYSVARYM